MSQVTFRHQFRTTDEDSARLSRLNDIFEGKAPSKHYILGSKAPKSTAVEVALKWARSTGQSKEPSEGWRSADKNRQVAVMLAEDYLVDRDPCDVAVFCHRALDFYFDETAVKQNGIGRHVESSGSAQVLLPIELVWEMRGRAFRERRDYRDELTSRAIVAQQDAVRIAEQRLSLVSVSVPMTPELKGGYDHQMKLSEETGVHPLLELQQAWIRPLPKTNGNGAPRRI